MASDQRPSFSASSNTSHSSGERRRPSSSSYNRPSSPSYRLPPLPPSTGSLTSGTSIPAPAPISPNFAALPPVPPPKDPPMTHPITPKRKPVERQKSPLSNEAYFSSPASIMPGAFPSTPPASSPSQNAAYNSSPATSNNTSWPTSKSPKRPGSVRNFLSFKALRRSYDNNPSLNHQSNRPDSAGGDSMTSSLQPSLNKKRSGTFWRRKSSLGMVYGEGSPASSPNSATRGESLVEEKRPLTPAPEEALQEVPRRKSGTFWRRKSSLNLSSAFSALNGKDETQPQNAGLNGGASGGHTNGAQNGLTNGKHGGEQEDDGDDDATMEDLNTEKSLPEIQEPLSPRSYSPPPQLPVFVGGGGGLGGEDLFKDIH